MDRGVFIGGGLICASFLLAVLLNESAREVPRVAEPPKATEVEPAPTECEGTSRRALDPEAPSVTTQHPSSERSANDANCK